MHFYAHAERSDFLNKLKAGDEVILVDFPDMEKNHKREGLDFTEPRVHGPFKLTKVVNTTGCNSFVYEVRFVDDDGNTQVVRKTSRSNSWHPVHTPFRGDLGLVRPVDHDYMAEWEVELTRKALQNIYPESLTAAERKSILALA